MSVCNVYEFCPEFLTADIPALRMICSINLVVRHTKPAKNPPSSFPFPVPNEEGRWYGKSRKFQIE
jgi:hypothetical protein